MAVTHAQMSGRVYADVFEPRVNEERLLQSNYPIIAYAATYPYLQYSYLIKLDQCIWPERRRKILSAS